MCGIAGIVARVGGVVDQVALRRMTAALRHRGPDGEGYFVSDRAGLGHRRLSIIDLAGGAQPMYAAKGRYAAVVNGEIYNYRTLRAELRNAGCAFSTDSDSEVVVHGHAIWGNDLPKRLDGQFAYAVWDNQRQLLSLGRDRFGEKPLYYGQTPDGDWLFGSELSALIAHGDIVARCDPAALTSYLVAECAPSPQAMIANTHKLAPGTAVEIDVAQGTASVRRYWDLSFGEVPLDDTPATIRALREALGTAVSSRLIADVPVGVFSSGGLDSALVAAFAKRAGVGEVNTFSIGFDDPTYDETRYARLVAAALGVHHQVKRVRADEVRDLVPQIGKILDEPMADGSILPTYVLSRFAREHVKVALGGDGGDELFGGYPTMQLDAVAAPVLDAIPGWFGDMAGAFLRRLPVGTGYLALDFKLKQLTRGIGFVGAARHQAWLAAFLPDELTELLADDFLHGVDVDGSFDELQKITEASDAPSDGLRAVYFYVKRYLGDQVLTKVDRASMANGLEVRAPLLAPEVVDIARRLPWGLRTSHGVTKRALKAVARGLLPDVIIDRKKHGFGMPIDRWLRSELQEWMREVLSPERLASDGVFRPATVTRLMDEHTRGAANHRKQLWTLLVLHSWATAHDVSLR